MRFGWSEIVNRSQPKTLRLDASEGGRSHDMGGESAKGVDAARRSVPLAQSAPVRNFQHWTKAASAPGSRR